MLEGLSRCRQDERQLAMQQEIALDQHEAGQRTLERECSLSNAERDRKLLQISVEEQRCLRLRERIEIREQACEGEFLQRERPSAWAVEQEQEEKERVREEAMIRRVQEREIHQMLEKRVLQQKRDGAREVGEMEDLTRHQFNEERLQRSQQRARDAAEDRLRLLDERMVHARAVREAQDRRQETARLLRDKDEAALETQSWCLREEAELQQQKQRLQHQLQVDTLFDRSERLHSGRQEMRQRERIMRAPFLGQSSDWNYM